MWNRSFIAVDVEHCIIDGEIQVVTMGGRTLSILMAIFPGERGLASFITS